ncbi:hypothetical protein BV98_000344 [Sphingobium herbicidovorans NBRC 16415]|jgi:hypothetical protein|uniref:Uncharacterized protein n=1 Tax=Sphingobium herbicidovorans (strain ATCC 700291 / DSM 11019 / CCUG 56400 / KCTC 2939 / LMG 18315 / NBRC 16415 / MH) TaxID=1219045 RepID=A0A086PFC4_SPHHM|nr:hypothetical protein BV98_000344 [Sphingobium herbicidovorans NBRC 16415]
MLVLFDIGRLTERLAAAAIGLVGAAPLILAMKS